MINICLHVLPEIIIPVDSVSSRPKKSPVSRRQSRAVITSGLYVAKHRKNANIENFMYFFFSFGLGKGGGVRQGLSMSSLPICARSSCFNLPISGGLYLGSLCTGKKSKE